MTTCEALATKAELQELRDQLNLALGTKEDGSTQTLFEKDAGTTVVTAGVGVTLLGMATTNAPNVITDIVSSGNVTPLDFSKKKVKLSVIKGGKNVVQSVPLSTIGEVAGSGVIGSQGAVGAGITMAASLAVLSSLVSIAGSLLLNIATVKILDSRIEAEARGTKVQLDAINSSMLRLYDKQQGDIDAVVADLDANQEAVRENNRTIEAVRFEVATANEINSRQSQEITKANEAIRELKAQNASLREVIASNQIENQKIVVGLEAQLNTVDANLEQAQNIVNEQQATINAQGQEITKLLDNIADLESTVINIEAKYQELRDEFEILKDDIASGAEEVDERLTKLETKLISETAKAIKFGGISGAGIANKAAIASQEGIIRVVSKIVQVPYEPVGSNSTTSFNRTTEFNKTINDLVPRIQPGGDMTPEQVEDLRTGIITGVASDLSALLGTTFVPRLDNISSQVTNVNLRNNVQEGICQSLNSPNRCSVPGASNPVQGLRGMQRHLTNILGGANLVANGGIAAVVTSTNVAVTSGTFGLQAIHTFMTTAWRVTKADKIMNAVSMVMTVHNGMMLSNNLLSTVSEALNMSLNALNIRDENAEPIDIGNAVSSMLRNLVTAMIGEQNYAGLTARIAKANRIYQSSINVLDATNSLFDSARSVAESTAENTGKIGNALRESGVVYEDAYEEFAERVNPQSRVQRNIEKFRGTIEGIGESVETVTQISSEIVDFKDNVNELKEAKEEWETEVKEVTEEQKVEKDAAKALTQITTDIANSDFEPGVSLEVSND